MVFDAEEKKDHEHKKNICQHGRSQEFHVCLLCSEPNFSQNIF